MVPLHGHEHAGALVLRREDRHEAHDLPFWEAHEPEPDHPGYLGGTRDFARQCIPRGGSMA